MDSAYIINVTTQWQGHDDRPYIFRKISLTHFIMLSAILLHNYCTGFDYAINAFEQCKPVLSYSLLVVFYGWNTTIRFQVGFFLRMEYNNSFSNNQPTCCKPLINCMFLGKCFIIGFVAQSYRIFNHERVVIWYGD